MRLGSDALSQGRREDGLRELGEADRHLRAAGEAVDPLVVGRGERALAAAYLEAHLPERARELLGRARRALERGGAGVGERCEVLRDEAVASMLCGDLGGAGTLLREVLGLQEAALGERHPDLGRTLSILAEVLRLQGRLRDARPLLNRALELLEDALGPEHPQLGKTLGILAMLELDLGHPKRALGLLERAVTIEAAARSPDLLSTLHGLGVVQTALGDLTRAASTFTRLIALIERVAGDEQLDLVPPLNSLAALRVREGQLDQAMQHYQRALRLLELRLGPAHPDVGALLNNLAEVHLRRGELEEGELVLRRALTIREQALGAGHPDVAESLNNLGGVLLRLGRAQEATEALERAQEIWLATLGPDHALTAGTRATLHQAYRAQAGRSAATPRPAGALPPDRDRRQLLAWAGDPEARAALGDAAPELPHELTAWANGLARWGAPTLVRALIAAAEAAAPAFARERPGDTRLLQALTAARSWWQEPGPERAQVAAATAIGAACAASDAREPAATAAAWAVQRLTLAVAAAATQDADALLERGAEAIEAAARAAGPGAVTEAMARALRELARG